MSVATPSAGPALPEELTIYTAADSHAQLRAWAEACLQGTPRRSPRTTARTTARSTSRRSPRSAPPSPPQEADPAALQIDAQAVGECDAAGVQLLVALAHTLRAGGGTLELRSPSAALVAACRMLGAGFLVDPPETAEA